jgi:hypothetical protein
MTGQARSPRQTGTRHVGFFRTAAFGYIVTAAAWLLLVLAAVVYWYLINRLVPNAEGGNLRNTVRGSIGVFLALALNLFTRGLRAYGKRLRLARSASRVTGSPPVLYFRSFSDDTVSYYRQGDTFEELLRAVFRQTGPLRAIVRPDESLPPLGPEPMRFSNQEWHGAVENLIGNAAVVLLRPGDSDGVVWEARAAVQQLRDPSRLLIVLAPEPWGRALSNLAVRTKHYEAFRQRTVGIFPHPLPEIDEDALFIAFDPEWKPQVLSLKGSSRNYQGNPRAKLREVLQPFARRIGLPIRKTFWNFMSLAYSYGAVATFVAVWISLVHVPPWTEFVAPDGAFRVQTPVALAAEQPGVLPGWRQYRGQVDGRIYAVSSIRLPDASAPSGQIIQQVREDQETRLKGFREVRYTEVSLNQIPGVELVLRNGDDLVKERIYVSGKAAVLAKIDILNGEEPEDRPSRVTQKFFDSLRIPE